MSVKFLSLLFVFLNIFPLVSHGQLLDQGVTSIRALGMGNAYTAIVRDSDALFYNPASINRIGGVNLLLMDPKAGVSNVDTLTSLEDLQSDDGFASTIRELYGENIWLGGGGKAAVYLSHFAAALYSNIDFSMSINNPALPELDISMINDLGIATGVGFPIFPGMEAGLVVKKIDRTGDRKTYGSAFLGTLDTDQITTDFEKEGSAYSLDVGMNLSPPNPVMDVVISLVGKNIGNTKFEADNVALGAPPKDEEEWIMGVGLDFDAGLFAVRAALDYRQMTNNDVQIGKKINLGVELDFPIIDVRGGFHQGYYAAGATMSFGLFRVDAATYGVELGAYPGQIEDRRYVVQLSIEFGFNPGNMSFLGSGEGGSSGKRGRGGRPGGGLKQRR